MAPIFSYTDTLSPTLLLRCAHRLQSPDRSLQHAQPGLRHHAARAAGQPAGAEPELPPARSKAAFPRVSVSDLTTFGGTNASANHTNTGSASATITKIHGAADLEGRLRIPAVSAQRVRHQLSGRACTTFNRGFTQGPNPDVASATSGYSVASLLLGDSGQRHRRHQRRQHHYAEVPCAVLPGRLEGQPQADAQSGPALGQRGLAHRPLQRLQQLQSLDRIPAEGSRSESEWAACHYPGANGVSRTLLPSSNKNFQPRVGVRLSAQSKDGAARRLWHQLRSHDAGRLRQLDDRLQQRNDAWSPPPMAATRRRTRSAIRFRSGLIAPTGSSLGALTGVGTNLTGALYNMYRGYSQQWNFTVQHQPLSKPGCSRSVTWAIAGCTLFMYNQNLNWLPDSDLGPGLGARAIRFRIRSSASSRAGRWPPQPFPGRNCCCPTRSSPALPGFQGGVVNPFSYTEDSIYHALTLKIEKRFSNGFSFWRRIRNRS